MLETVVLPAFIGGWVGFSAFIGTRSKSWTVRIGGGFLLAATCAAAIGLVLS